MIKERNLKVNVNIKDKTFIDNDLTWKKKSKDIHLIAKAEKRKEAKVKRLVTENYKSMKESSSRKEKKV